MAGIFSALPALFINSWIFPEIVYLFAPNISSTGLGRLMAVISAPVGEELCKAGAIWFFASKIKSPKHGFQIGFTVGLGFAILENYFSSLCYKMFQMDLMTVGILVVYAYVIFKVCKPGEYLKKGVVTAVVLVLLMGRTEGLTNLKDSAAKLENTLEDGVKELRDDIKSVVGKSNINNDTVGKGISDLVGGGVMGPLGLYATIC